MLPTLCAPGESLAPHGTYIITDRERKHILERKHTTVTSPQAPGYTLKELVLEPSDVKVQSLTLMLKWDGKINIRRGNFIYQIIDEDGVGYAAEAWHSGSDYPIYNDGAVYCDGKISIRTTKGPQWLSIQNDRVHITSNEADAYHFALWELTTENQIDTCLTTPSADGCQVFWEQYCAKNPGVVLCPPPNNAPPNNTPPNNTPPNNTPPNNTPPNNSPPNNAPNNSPPSNTPSNKDAPKFPWWGYVLTVLLLILVLALIIWFVRRK